MLKAIQPMGPEVLQASALHDFPWSESDPSAVVQEVEAWGPIHSKLLDSALHNHRFNFERFLAETRHCSVAEKVWRLLSATAFNFNGVEKVRGETIWRERIDRTVAAGGPVEVAYPLICKIDNAAKRMSLVNVTAGERAVIRFFRDIGEFVKSFYPPGLRIHILADATLYNGALFVPPPSALAYMHDVATIIQSDGAEGSVELHDYSALLAPHYREFERCYSTHYAALVAAPVNDENYGSLPTSVRTSVNSRRLGLSYAQLRTLFGPQQTSFSVARAELDQQARFALVEQLAIKLACGDLDLPSRLWPNHVRATCHKGLKSGVAVLGLRCYPEYYGSSRLLPYHGMPLIDLDKAGKPRLLVLPEVSLRGSFELVRVQNEELEPVLYYTKTALNVPG